MNGVEAVLERQAIPTYGLGRPEKNPLFFEKRVYQGSCGKVYPVPFIDKVFQDDPPRPVDYQSVRLENDYVRLTLLPEIGGRIFAGQDKTNGDYDFFYRQDVIKPALVGLAGPWISGGVEFNWPQHHRPGTYLPTDVFIEEEADGARTVWMSEHDPLFRLKGMHGIRLRPGSSVVELRGRLFNRTAFTQTFLWWANVAARVHDNYQSFFPTDVHYVADHAVRAQSSFPVANNDYYGVDYANRPGENDLGWYKNIPVPTSYMICETDGTFFGGYDYDTQGGFVHVANPHVSPGKKQWTRGNHDFGVAWDRELTDENGPYIELMAGVYTDNQPDFSYLLPGETKTFSQFWWPYSKIGAVQWADEHFALRMAVGDDRSIDLGLAASSAFEGLQFVLTCGDQILLDQTFDVSPESPWQHQTLRFEGDEPSALKVEVRDREGGVQLSYRPPVPSSERSRQVATEPPMPDAIDSADELYFTGEHLELYRHPTRYPELYWNEALQRDPADARCNLGLGKQALQRGAFESAADHLARAIGRLTARHPNPVTGEAHYFLGLARMFQQRFDEAYALFYKATWNSEWRSPAYYAIACLDVRGGALEKALEHLEATLNTNRQHNKAQVLKATVLHRLGHGAEAGAVLDLLLKTDPLDLWARFENLRQGRETAADFCRRSRNDAQTLLDIAFDYADAGLMDLAAEALRFHHAHPTRGVAVPNPMERSSMTHYALAWCLQDPAELTPARTASPDYLFPSRLHEQLVLEWALAQPGSDRNAAYGLGNYFYDKKRHEEAITCWEASRQADAHFATVHRNLAIAYWNTRRDGEAAKTCYEIARACDPIDARLISETAQLWGKLAVAPEQRLRFLEENRFAVEERDDAAVELAALYNETGAPQKALDLLASRSFHPWEGGEGKVLRQYTLAHLQLGQSLIETDAAQALSHFEQAMDTPDSLGEKYHLLQAQADVNYWLGKALRALGREAEAIVKFEEAANESGDFEGMEVTAHSELSFYRGKALGELGREADALALFNELEAFGERKLNTPAQIDYFATSLPNLLVFEEDLEQAKNDHARKLIALAQSALPDAL